MEWWTPRQIVQKYKRADIWHNIGNASYIIGWHNLLKNDGIVECDQKPHSDYACRLRKSWVGIYYIVILLSILFVSYLIRAAILLYVKWTYNRVQGYYWVTCLMQWSSSFISNSYEEIK